MTNLIQTLIAEVDTLVLNGLKLSSAAPFRSAIRALAAFLASQPDPELLDAHTLQDFDAHLRTRLGNSSTVATYHSYLRSVLRSAHSSATISFANPYDAFRPRHTWHTRPRRALSDAEVDALRSIPSETLSDSQRVTRDRFLFAVATGVRISDARTLTPAAIVRSAGSTRLDFVSTKGRGQRVTLPLDVVGGGDAARIITAYNTSDASRPIFPRQSLPTIHRALSALATLAGIQKLTFHMARHTCATRLALASASPLLIRAVLGHANVATSMRYVHTSGQWVEQELRRISTSL